MGGRVDIAEYRRDLLPLERVRGGYESERGHDHFAVKPQRADGNFQRDRAVAHGDAMAYSEEFGNLLLELLDVGAVVRQPVAVQHIVDSREETVAIANIRPPDMQFFGKSGRPAENR